MTACAALLDSNVIVAALGSGHQHHAESAALLDAAQPGSFAVAAHSFAEAFVTLTRQSNAPTLGFTPAEAQAALSNVRAIITLVGLTPPQQIEGVRRYAASGGIGARLYDALVGHVAVVHAIPAIITWNTHLMAGLFPKLRVVTPAAF